MIAFESFDSFGELIRAIVLSSSLSIALFIISLSMFSAYRKQISFKIGFIILLGCTGIIIYGALFFLSKIFNILYWSNDDFENWAAVVVEIGIGAFITGMIFLYDREHNKKIAELEESRKISEHQHYKERLTYEFPIFSERVNTMADTISSGQSNAAQLNMFHAKTNLESLRSINSIFDIPAEIRSQFDDILGDYTAILENVEHGCMRITDIHIINADCAKKARNFFSNDFFKEKNTDKINIRLNGINQNLDRIISKNTKTNS